MAYFKALGKLIVGSVWTRYTDGHGCYRPRIIEWIYNRKTLQQVQEGSSNLGALPLKFFILGHSCSHVTMKKSCSPYYSRCKSDQIKQIPLILIKLPVQNSLRSVPVNMKNTPVQLFVDIMDQQLSFWMMYVGYVNVFYRPERESHTYQ